MRHLLLTLLFTCNVAVAQLLLPESNSMIHNTVLSPFGQIPLSEGCRIGLNAGITNEQSYSEGEWGNMGIDTELWKLELTARAHTSVGEFGVNVPVQYVWGGVLDAPLDVFHSLVQLNRIVNPERGRSLAFYQLTTGEERFYDQPAFGLGDVTLSWAYPWDDLWVKGTVGVPVGRREQFMGSGSWKSSVQVGYGTGFAGLMGQVGWVWNSDSTEVSALGLKPTYGLKAWSFLPWDLPIKIETEVRTSPFQTGGTFTQPTWALRFVFSGVGFQEDLTPALPDVTLSTAQEWDCP